MNEEFNSPPRTEGSGTGNPVGRPRKCDPPRIQYDEVDRALVFGEPVPTEDGRGTTIVFPSYRDLAMRYGVAHSVIADYAKRHNCARRRANAQVRIESKADAKLVELRAEAIALSKDDALRIIDQYLVGFEDAVRSGRVRFDDPGAFDRMCRLKEFLQGGADSRQEVHGSLSLDEIQARHRQMLRTVEETSAAERGTMGRGLPAAAGAGTSVGSVDPPATSSATAAEKQDVQVVGGGRFSPDDAGRFSGEREAPEGGRFYDVEEVQ